MLLNLSRLLSSHNKVFWIVSLVFLEVKPHAVGLRNHVGSVSQDKFVKSFSDLVVSCASFGDHEVQENDRAK